MAASEYFAVRRGSQSLTNEVIWSDLSYAAVGLLLVMLACVDDQPKGYRAFQGRGLGQVKCRAALRELEEAGLRVRVRYRRDDGQLREFVVVSDLPIGEDFAIGYVMARKDIPESERHRLQVASVASQDDEGKTPCQHRASKTKHGADKGKRNPENSSVQIVDDLGKTPSGDRAPTHRSTVGRATVSRATVHRGANNYVINKGSKDPQPNQTRAREETDPLQVGSGWVGEIENHPPVDSEIPDVPEPALTDDQNGQVPQSLVDKPGAHPDTSQTASEAVLGGLGNQDGQIVDVEPGNVLEVVSESEASDDDWFTIAKCLPAQMQAVDPGKASWVAGLLRKRLDAGWHPQKLRDTLAGNQLPAEVKNLTGLVAYRIKGLPVDPPLSASDFERIHARHKRDVDREVSGVPAPMPKGLKRRIKALSK